MKKTNSVIVSDIFGDYDIFYEKIVFPSVEFNGLTEPYYDYQDIHRLLMEEYGDYYFNETLENDKWSNRFYKHFASVMLQYNLIWKTKYSNAVKNLTIEDLLKTGNQEVRVSSVVRNALVKTVENAGTGNAEEQLDSLFDNFASNKSDDSVNDTFSKIKFNILEAIKSAKFSAISADLNEFLRKFENSFIRQGTDFAHQNVSTIEISYNTNETLERLTEIEAKNNEQDVELAIQSNDIDDIETTIPVIQQEITNLKNKDIQIEAALVAIAITGGASESLGVVTSDPTNESISGAALTQSEINKENKTYITSLNTLQVDTYSPTTESNDPLAISQKHVNENHTNSINTHTTQIGDRYTKAEVDALISNIINNLWDLGEIYISYTKNATFTKLGYTFTFYEPVNSGGALIINKASEASVVEKRPTMLEHQQTYQANLKDANGNDQGFEPQSTGQGSHTFTTNGVVANPNFDISATRNQASGQGVYFFYVSATPDGTRITEKEQEVAKDKIESLINDTTKKPKPTRYEDIFEIDYKR